MDENNTKSESPRSLLKIAIILGSLALLAAIANLVQTQRTIKCIKNLRDIEAAKQQWALENNKTNSDTVITWNDIRLYLERDINEGHVGKTYDPLIHPPLRTIYCPQDKTRNCLNSYTLGDLQTKPKCKINLATHKLD